VRGRLKQSSFRHFDVQNPESKNKYYLASGFGISVCLIFALSKMTKSEKAEELDLNFQLLVRRLLPQSLDAADAEFHAFAVECFSLQIQILSPFGGNVGV